MTVNSHIVEPTLGEEMRPNLVGPLGSRLHDLQVVLSLPVGRRELDDRLLDFRLRMDKLRVKRMNFTAAAWGV